MWCFTVHSGRTPEPMDRLKCTLEHVQDSGPLEQHRRHRVLRSFLSRHELWIRTVARTAALAAKTADEQVPGEYDDDFEGVNTDHIRNGLDRRRHRRGRQMTAYTRSRIWRSSDCIAAASACEAQAEQLANRWAVAGGAVVQTLLKIRRTYVHLGNTWSV